MAPKCSEALLVQEGTVIVPFGALLTTKSASCPMVPLREKGRTLEKEGLHAVERSYIPGGAEFERQVCPHVA